LFSVEKTICTWIVMTMTSKAYSGFDVECSECRVNCVNLQCETEEPVQKKKKMP